MNATAPGFVSAVPSNRRWFLRRVATASAAIAASPRLFAQAPPRPRVLLRSSWQTVNIGDIGHTPGMLRLLHEHLPGVEVTLWPANIGDGVREMLLRRFPDLRIASGQEEVARAFQENGFLLHGSGPSLVARKQVAEWKAQTGKSYGVMGITISSVDDETRSLLDGARFLFCRDTVSLKLAQQKGVRCPVIEFAPDAAFGVDLRNDAAAVPFLAKHRLAERNFICAIPRLRYTPYWEIHGKTMTAEDKRKTAINEQFKERDHAVLRDALVALVRQTSLKVLVCPEDKSHMKVGREMIMDRIPADLRDRFVWRADYWLTDEAVSVYSRALALVSMDMHSPIMAVANGTPAVHLRFKEQTSKGQMWRDIGLGEWLFDLDVPSDRDQVTNALLNLASDPRAARAKVAKAMGFVKERQSAAMKQLLLALHG